MEAITLNSLIFYVHHYFLRISFLSPGFSKTLKKDRNEVIFKGDLET